jgi:hypothetical protein
VYAGASAPTARATMTLFTSTDLGASWGHKTVIWAGPAGYADVVVSGCCARVSIICLFKLAVSAVPFIAELN